MAEEASGDYNQAEISYDKAVLMDLDNSEYWISKAAVQEKKGDYPGAITSLNRVISTHPENVYSLMRKAMILVRLGMYSEARTFIELASKMEPLNMKILVIKRDIYRMGDDADATKSICKNILGINPGDKKTAMTLARMHIKTGNLDDARAVLVELNPDNPFSDDDYEIHQLLREIYHSQSKTHEEISTCKTILSFRPDDRATKAALADAYIKRGMVDAAKALYNELHQLSPEDSNFSLKKAEMADDRETALSVLMESLNNDPDNVPVLIEVSRMLYDDGKFKDSLIYANRAIDADPMESQAYIRKIMALFSMNNFSGVIATADEASSNVRVKDPLIWKYSGDSHMILGDYSNALILYDTAMKLGITSRDIYYNRGMCQEALEMYDAAISSYTMAYQKDPEDTESMMRAAAVFLAQDKDQSAGRVLEQAIAADPQHSKAIIARATIFASKSNDSGVKRLFDHCISNGVDEETKQIVAELMEKARNKEVVAPPIIPLVMPTATENNFDENIGRSKDEPELPSGGEPEKSSEEEPEEETSEETTEEELPSSEEDLVDDWNKQWADEGTQEEVSEESSEEESGEIQEIPGETEEDLEDGFAVMEEEEPAEETSEEEPEEDSWAVQEEGPEEAPAEKEDETVTEEPEQEEPEQEQPEQDEPEEKEPGDEESNQGALIQEEEPEQPEVTVEEPVAEPEPEAEKEEPTAEDFDDDDTEAVFFVDDDDDTEAEPVPEPKAEGPVAEPEPEVEEPPIIPVGQVDDDDEPEESEPRKSVKEYAVDLLRYAHEHGEMPGENEAAALAGIPDDVVEDVLDYLSDISEYGEIDPTSGEFRKMEEMSFKAIVGTGADDIEDDPVISLTSAFFDSGANDIDTAKKLVAYVYEAITGDIDVDAVYDQVSEIADDVEFNGSPKTVFEIMSKYHIGVYSARAVKVIVFSKKGQ
jgi:tetratricopeptide (TPR) repeat protein